MHLRRRGIVHEVLHPQAAPVRLRPAGGRDAVVGQQTLDVPLRECQIVRVDRHVRQCVEVFRHTPHEPVEFAVAAEPRTLAIAILVRYAASGERRVARLVLLLRDPTVAGRWWRRRRRGRHDDEHPQPRRQQHDGRGGHRDPTEGPVRPPADRRAQQLQPLGAGDDPFGEPVGCRHSRQLAHQLPRGPQPIQLVGQVDILGHGVLDPQRVLGRQLAVQESRQLLANVIYIVHRFRPIIRRDLPGSVSAGTVPGAAGS